MLFPVINNGNDCVKFNTLLACKLLPLSCWTQPLQGRTELLLSLSLLLFLSLLGGCCCSSFSFSASKVVPLGGYCCLEDVAGLLSLSLLGGRCCSSFSFSASNVEMSVQCVIWIFFAFINCRRRKVNFSILAFLLGELHLLLGNWLLKMGLWRYAILICKQLLHQFYQATCWHNLNFIVGRLFGLTVATIAPQRRTSRSLKASSMTTWLISLMLR